MMLDTDVVMDVIEVLSAALPEATVGDSLPETDDLHRSLPCVVVDILPSQEKAQAWGGDGFPTRLDEVAVDVEVFAKSRAQAAPLARKVRALLHQLPHLEENEVVAVGCPTFATREDLNPRVKVLGAVADLTLHA